MIYRSPSPDVPVPDQSWPAYLETAVQPHLERVAIDDPVGDRSVGYRDLFDAIRDVAAGLRSRGYGKGDVLGIYAGNSIEFVIAFQAVLRIGGTATTVNPMNLREELERQLRHAGACALFSTRACRDVALAAADACRLRAVFLLDEADGPLAFGALRESAGERGIADIDPGGDLAVLPYSSGTTGLSKGVMLTHRNLVAHNVQLLALRDTSVPSAEDRVLMVLPLFHIFAMTVVMNLALSHGATIVLLPQFDPEGFLRTIQARRVTRMYLVPPIINFLAKHPLVAQFDLSSLNYILSGAAPLGVDLARAAARRIGCPVVQGYGLTETSPVTHVFPERGERDDPGSIGVLVANTEARIVDLERGGDVSPGERGELWVRGPQVMRGYLENPEATAASIDDEGWFHTGDVATADPDGYFHIVDRAKELIKYKGYQVAPAELEALLATHPAVADCAVVPEPDNDCGEIPKAFVVRREPLDEDALMAWVAERVAPYRRIRRVVFTDAIPKSPSGKILRRLLR
ncbi:MAG: AMP-binding protein [Rhodocyclaceae bacterium]|nr:AMP-binding protein [Rhodocyclaceae bacterium]